MTTPKEITELIDKAIRQVGYIAPEARTYQEGIIADLVTALTNASEFVEIEQVGWLCEHFTGETHTNFMGSSRVAEGAMRSLEFFDERSSVCPHALPIYKKVEE